MYKSEKIRNKYKVTQLKLPQLLFEISQCPKYYPLNSKTNHIKYQVI